MRRLPVQAVLTRLVLMLVGVPLPAIAQGGQTARAEDLAVFRRDVLAVDQSYSVAARAEAERRLNVLETRAETLSDARFAVLLAQIVALADNGHSMTISGGTGTSAGRVGVRVAPFGTDFFVVHAMRPHDELLGARLVAIDGISISRIRDSVHTLIGGTSAWRDRMAPLVLETPALLQALGLTRAPIEATYRFARRDGRVAEVKLRAIPDADATMVRRGASVLAPASGPGEWSSLLPPDAVPWSLQEMGPTMRRRDAPELDAVVIQLRANIDGETSISAFLDESAVAGRDAGRHNIVLDMRMNGGGNLQLTRAWMSSIVSRLPPDGRVVVLTSPWTFSAAISSVGYLKQAGGSRVTLIGEAPGDRLTFFAEGSPVRLPNTGAMFLVATQRHDYRTGCQGFSDCHGPVVRYPIAVATLDPDVLAPWTIDSYAAGRDPAMEAAARLLTPRRARVLP